MVASVSGFSYVVLLASAIIWLCCWFEVVFAIKNPEEFVSITTGTFTDGQSFSTGNTLPLISLPWGFNNWAPQTQDGSRYSTSWWFSGNVHMLKWFRCTHQPSPWIGDYAWFLFMPQLVSFFVACVLLNSFLLLSFLFQFLLHYIYPLIGIVLYCIKRAKCNNY
jgi:hypothetical protein